MKLYIYIKYKKLLLDLNNKTMKILVKFKKKFLEKPNTLTFQNKLINNKVL